MPSPWGSDITLGHIMQFWVSESEDKMCELLCTAFWLCVCLVEIWGH